MLIHIFRLVSSCIVLVLFKSESIGCKPKQWVYVGFYGADDFVFDIACLARMRLFDPFDA